MSNFLYKIYGEALSLPWFPKLRSFDIRDQPEVKLDQLNKKFPNQKALYFICQNQGVSYIGISGIRGKGGLFRRLKNHIDTTKPIEFVYAFDSGIEKLQSLETQAICLMRPEWNKSKKLPIVGVYNDHIDRIADFYRCHFGTHAVLPDGFFIRMFDIP